MVELVEMVGLAGLVRCGWVWLGVVGSGYWVDWSISCVVVWLRGGLVVWWFGQLVRWSVGALVALVRGCVGAWVCWCVCALACFLVSWFVGLFCWRVGRGVVVLVCGEEGEGERDGGGRRGQHEHHQFLQRCSRPKNK